MDLQARIQLMIQLGEYLNMEDPAWLETQSRAFHHNAWFVPEFTSHATKNITEHFLQKDKLQSLVQHYHLDDNIQPKTVGIVMAGNIPLVGFHDFLCTFISGHKQIVKLSSKDNQLFPHLFKKLTEMDSRFSAHVQVADTLKGCDAYIATGSNNTSRYFESYFAKYPNIIRKGKTSVAVLTGEETNEELEKLSDDVHLYFGRGCRSITKLYVPEGYNFEKLLGAFGKYKWFSDHHRFKNNFDYQLALVMMNKVYYMTNGTVLLLESDQQIPPVGTLFYSFYKPGSEPVLDTEDLQCIEGKGYVPFGDAQNPGICEYADNVDTMAFLLSI